MITISSKSKLGKQIAELIESGRYQSAEEVIREAMRLLVERDNKVKLKELKKEIEVGKKAFREGRGIKTDRAGMIQVMEAIKRGERPSSVTFKAKFNALKKEIDAGVKDIREGRVIKTDREGLAKIMDEIKRGGRPSSTRFKQ